MAFATRLAKVRDHRKHCNEWTRMCYHQGPPLRRVVGARGGCQASNAPLEHNPLSLLGAYYAIPLRKLNDPDIRGYPERCARGSCDDEPVDIQAVFARIWEVLARSTITASVRSNIARPPRACTPRRVPRSAARYQGPSCPADPGHPAACQQPTGLASGSPYASVRWRDSRWRGEKRVCPSACTSGSRV
jgi:hypothetical protein